MPAVNSVDLFVVVVMAFFTLAGKHRGLTSGVLGIVSWIIGVVITVAGFPLIMGKLMQLQGSPLIAFVTSGVIIFFLVVFVLTSVKNSIITVVKSSKFVKYDTYGGVLFGVLQGLTIIMVCYGLIAFVYGARKPSWLIDARTYPVLRGVAELMEPMIPEAPRVRDFLDTFNSGNAEKPASDKETPRARKKPAAPTEILPSKKPDTSDTQTWLQRKREKADETLKRSRQKIENVQEEFEPLFPDESKKPEDL